MKPIILSLARDDLKDIRDRLVEFGSSPPKKFRESFTMFCTNVTKMPQMYPQYDQNPKYRRAVIVYDYLVFYQAEKVSGRERAMIYRVLHGKRDILPLLDSDIHFQ
jgi:plasmid stabilization system protein ParE